jgi:hypothetical protein
VFVSRKDRKSSLYNCIRRTRSGLLMSEVYNEWSLASSLIILFFCDQFGNKEKRLTADLKVILIQSSLMLKSLDVLRAKYWRHFRMKISSAYPLTLQLCTRIQHTRGVPMCHCCTPLIVINLQRSTYTHVRCRAITPGDTYEVLFCRVFSFGYNPGV